MRNCKREKFSSLTEYVPSNSDFPFFFFFKWLCLCAQLLSHVRLSVAPWTAAYQYPLSMGFPRQKYWSGLPFPPPGFLVIIYQFIKFLKSMRWSIGDIQKLKLFKYLVKTDIISLLPFNLIITSTLKNNIFFIFKNMNTWDV